MKKYDNFCRSLANLEESCQLEPPYSTVVLSGLVSLFQICFEQSWKAMKDILERHGYAESATGSTFTSICFSSRKMPRTTGLPPEAWIPVIYSSFREISLPFTLRI